MALTLLVKYCGGLLALRRSSVIVVATVTPSENFTKNPSSTFCVTVPTGATNRTGAYLRGYKGTCAPKIAKIDLTADAEYAANLLKCQYVVVKV